EQRKEGTLTPEPLQPKPSEQVVSAIDTEFKVTVHGETYDIQITGVSPTSAGERRFYMTVDGVPEEVSLESLAQFKRAEGGGKRAWASKEGHVTTTIDRKSTRLNSSHVKISYAVFCLKKKKHE